MTTTENINEPSYQDIQVEMARTRTLLALDRTLLAWVRTSLTLSAFGFTLAKFVHDLIAAGTLHLMDAKYPREFGIALMTLGIVGLLAGAFDHWRSVKRLQPTLHISFWSPSLIVALILAVLSAFVMTSIVSNLGP